MRVVFSSLVAASLLIHAMIGCCWHHAHGATCCDGSPAAQNAETGCCHHDHGVRCDKQHGQPSHAPCKGPSHCQGLCTYLPPHKTQLDQLQSHVPADVVAIAPPTCDMHVTTLLHTERSHESATGPPVRLHLLHQVLLI